ncbi:hypothetical protein [Gorillibacterium timonense]|uniref:hypothetical protein n=1 Tax=Gorillibacterium timonense TaxID=1689269 RepID=UPI00071C5000|nr:hypothetical protein [Gorillibacterium timonense]
MKGFPLTKRNKWLILLGVAGVLLLTAIAWSIPRFQDRVFYVFDSKYRLAEHTDNTSVYRTRSGDGPIRVTDSGGGKEFAIVIGNERINVKLISESEEERLYDITDAVGTRRAKAASDRWVEVRQEDGSYFPEMVSSANMNGQWVYDTPGGHLYPVSTLLEMIDPTLRQKDGNPVLYVLGVLFLAVSFIGWRFREFFFKLKYTMWVEDPEPTDFYMTSTKIGSIVVAIVGVGFLLGAIFSVM